MAADHDLIGIGERAPFDALSVDEHTVEAAVVEHPQAVRLADDQRVAPRHGGVVEADVGREATPDPSPFALKREHGDVFAIRAVREVLPWFHEAVAELLEPLLIVARRRREINDGRMSGREQQCNCVLGSDYRKILDAHFR